MILNLSKYPARFIVLKSDYSIHYYVGHLLIQIICFYYHEDRDTLTNIIIIELDLYHEE